ncbi:MAG: HAD family hydrolase, partial [Thermomicrobia bacterium]|nr:HAD family hydrolase [Thermomicrobia bacterium]
VLMDETLGDEQTRKQIVRLLALRGHRMSLTTVRGAWDAAVSSYDRQLVRGALNRLVDEQTANTIQQELRDHSRPTPPYAETKPTMETFAKRFGTGVIANQSATIREWAEIVGFGEAVHLWCLSGELGFGKPDPRIFQYALDRAACDPKEAAMVGDRLDYDIAPAKRLGILTIRIRRGPHAIQAPRAREETPDLTFATLTALCRRICLPPESADPTETGGFETVRDTP